MQNGLDFRTRLLESEGCQYSCQIEADYGERVYDFSLDCIFDGEDGHLTVTAPENIAGITAVVDRDDASLEFDGLSLQYGELANGHVAPLTGPWLLGSAWAEDYISHAGAEGEQTRITYRKGYHDEEVIIDTWLRDGLPVYAEVSCEGRRVLTIQIQDFVFSK